MQCEHRHLSVNGDRIWVKLVNPAQKEHLPTIVLLHDALGSVAQWKDFPEQIHERTGCPVMLYDRAGHGLSSPRKNGMTPAFLDREALIILPELLHQLNIETPILFGHSDGGTIALIYAAKIRTHALILEAAHIMTEELTRQGVLQLANEKEKIIDKLRKYHGDKAIALFDGWVDLWSGEWMMQWNIAYLLERIDCPTLIIQGEEDNYGTDRQVQKIERGIKGWTQVCLLESCGHTPHREYPEKVLQNVRLFLDRQLPL